MNKRPHSITVIGWLFIAVGVLALAYHFQPQHLADFKSHPSLGNELVWIFVIRALAIVSGVFMLRGHNWARWLLAVWLAYHVILSGFHSLLQVVVHGLLFAVILYFLFSSAASVFFRARGATGALRATAEDKPRLE